MRRYFKISLLLLLLQPLFLLNVHALDIEPSDSVPQEEMINENISNEVQNVEEHIVEENDNLLSLDEILEMIPNYYDLNYTQEEAIFSYDEDGNNQVAVEIENQIIAFLDENNISLGDYGYYLVVERLFYNPNSDYSIFDYEISLISDGEGFTYKKTIAVSFVNDDDYDEETQENIDDAFSDSPEIEIENVYDFYTDEIIGEENSIFNFFEERLPEEYYSFFFEVVDQEESDFTQIYTGYSYLFMNEVFYKVFPTITRFITQMTVSSDISQSDILQEVRDRIEEFVDDDYPIQSIEMDNEGDVYSSETLDYFGNIEVKKESKKSYSYTYGANSTIVGVGQLLVRVDCLTKKLIRIFIDGVEINSNQYSITIDDITISSNYLGFLQKGNHSLVVRFSDGDAKTNFTLKEEERVEPQQEEPYVPYYPSYTDYHYYNYDYNDSNEPVEEVKQEEKTEEKNEKEEKSVLLPSDVVKESESSNKNELKEEDNNEEKKEEEDSRFNLNYIPIIIVALAFIFGVFGGYLYKKSLED